MIPSELNSFSLNRNDLLEEDLQEELINEEVIDENDNFSHIEDESDDMLAEEEEQ